MSETPATALLRQQGVAFTEHAYEYLEHGGAQDSAQVLGLGPYCVVKTLTLWHPAMHAGPMRPGSGVVTNGDHRRLIPVGDGLYNPATPTQTLPWKTFCLLLWCSAAICWVR